MRRVAYDALDGSKEDVMAQARQGGGGWRDFSAVVFAIVGISNAIQGLTAIFKKEYFHEASLVYSNLQFWGIVWLIVGVLQVVAAMLLFGKQPSGRVLGIVLAIGASIVAFMSLEGNPSWGFAVLAMNLLVVYGLTAHPEAFSEPIDMEPGWTTSGDRPPTPPAPHVNM